MKQNRRPECFRQNHSGSAVRFCIGLSLHLTFSPSAPFQTGTAPFVFGVASSGDLFVRASSSSIALNSNAVRPISRRERSVPLGWHRAGADGKVLRPRVTPESTTKLWRLT